jgi:hypothetical protein
LKPRHDKYFTGGLACKRELCKRFTVTAAIPVHLAEVVVGAGLQAVAVAALDHLQQQHSSHLKIL